MKNVLDVLQETSDRVAQILTAILQSPTSIITVIVRVILFFILFFLFLVILGFTGILEDPSGFMHF